VFGPQLRKKKKKNKSNECIGEDFFWFLLLLLLLLLWVFFGGGGVNQCTLFNTIDKKESRLQNMERFTNLRVILAQGPC